ASNVRISRNIQRTTMETEGAKVSAVTPILCTLFDLLVGCDTKKLGGKKPANSRNSSPPMLTIVNERPIQASGGWRVWAKSAMPYGSKVDNAVHRTGITTATAYAKLSRVVSHPV
ncbi:MAG: hypothetical protein WCC94_02260, partial [Candidatus Bathyarchaeia archaeon]